MKRIPALDGIRGIAIGAVLLYHMSPQAAIAKLPLPAGVRTVLSGAMYPISSFGWAGVDLFFVLSGFLITGILMETKEAPRYFRAFYARRILRIFPIYYLTLAVLLIALPLARPAWQATLLFKSQVAFWLYLQNWLEAFRTYTGFRSEFLGHTWSLAIEEQFYMFWPLAVFLLKPRAFFRLCLGCIIAALGLRCVANAFAGSPFAAYSLIHFSLLTRVDALAFGAIVAYMDRYEAERLASWVGRRSADKVLAAFFLLLVLVVWRAPQDPQINNGLFRVVGYTVLSVLFTTVLIKAIHGPMRGPLSFALRNRALTACGVISYGLYMYHWPIYYWTREFLLRRHATLLFPFIALPCTFAAAWLSFALIETPLLRLKRFFRAWTGSDPARDTSVRISFTDVAPHE